MKRPALGPWRWVALLLFGYVLARPVSTNQVLVPVLAGIGAVAAATVFFARRRLAPTLVPAVIVTFLFAAVGLAAGPTNPGFLSALLVFVVAPLLYWMVSAAVDERMLRAAFTAAAVVTIFSGVTIALYAAQSSGSIPAIVPTWLQDQYGAGFGVRNGAGLGGSDFTQVRFYGLSTLVATGPMWVGSLFLSRDALLPPLWLRAVAAVAATAGALSGGRRALALVLVLAPVLLWLLKLMITRRGISRPRGKGRVLLVLGGAGVLLAVALTPGAVSGGGVFGAAWRSLTNYLTGSNFVGATAADDRLRSYQATRLLDAWAEKPIFGHGLGATMQGFWRDPVQPWRWELQYHALLFQTGVVGALLILLGAALTLNAVIRAARARPDLVPSLLVACLAAAGMLIGNATNPYLQAPGYVWSIFLPVAVANVMLMSGKAREAAAPAGSSAVGGAGVAVPPTAGSIEGQAGMGNTDRSAGEASGNEDGTAVGPGRRRKVST